MNRDENELSWAGASWARSFELAEQELEAWRPKEKEVLNHPITYTLPGSQPRPKPEALRTSVQRMLQQQDPKQLEDLFAALFEVLTEHQQHNVLKTLGWKPQHTKEL